MKKKYAVFKRIGVCFLTLYFAVTFVWGAVWYIKENQIFVSDKDAMSPCFLPISKANDLYIRALKERPSDVSAFSSGWKVAYVHGVNFDYINKGYLHLGVVTEEGEQMNLLIREDKKKIKRFVQRFSFLIGVPIVAFSNHIENKVYSFRELEITGYFRVLEEIKYWPIRQYFNLRNK
ncbi:hypothetical protein KKA27_02710 [Patescibacteria group bacterium]|nr:hypothetical protein [Patescibacteria group bacterium]